MTAPSLVVVGSLNMDLALRVPHLPQPGETVLGKGLLISPGGKGANQAVAAARLGARVALVGCRGQDVFGDELSAALRAEGVDQSFVRSTPSAKTGTAMILLDEAGQNQIAVAPGANGCLTPADVDRAETAIAGAAVVAAQLEVPLAAIERAAELAARYDVPFILNPAPALPLPTSLLAATWLLVPNQVELAALFPGDSVEAQLAAAHATGACRVLVTLGAHGARYSSAEDRWHIPTHAVAALDATAAGDAFVSALAVALAEGQELRAAAELASAAGALAVTRLGAQSSLPTRAEVAQLMTGAGADADRQERRAR